MGWAAGEISRLWAKVSYSLDTPGMEVVLLHTYDTVMTLLLLVRIDLHDDYL